MNQAQLKKATQRSLFDSHNNPKEVNYPEVLPYADAIRRSYWVHTEYQWSGDEQDYRVGLTDAERQVVLRTLLSISQVEVVVKTFWRDLGIMFPQPEFDEVGVTFAENEVRHQLGYSHLLDKLGLQEEFSKIKEYPALRDRMDYLDRFNEDGLTPESNPRKYLGKLMAFSMFIEYVSLFSQFYLMKSFHRHRNQFRGVSNLVDATTKEEELHGEFGFLMVNLFRDERPDLFDYKMDQEVLSVTDKALRAEMKVLDWIFEDVELDFITKEEAMDFVKHRVKLALEGVQYGGYITEGPLESALVEVDPSKYEWFNVELLATKHYDFFNQRPTNYNRMSKSFDADDLF